MTKLYNEQTLQINGAEVIVRTAMGSALRQSAEMKRQFLVNTGTLGEDELFRLPIHVMEGINSYLTIIFSTHKVKGKLGFSLPTPHSTVDEIIDGYKIMDKSIRSDDWDQWYVACLEVNAPPGDPDNQPIPLEGN